jgi:hypothetical protein
MPQLARKLQPLLPLAPAGECTEQITLLDLVAAVADVAESDEEVIATVQYLIDSGRVTLVGQFRNADLLPH